MRNDNVLNETLDDVIKSGYNLPKSRTNKVLSNMKNIFLGSILGTGLILGINYFNHKKIQRDFKKDVKYEVSSLVNESISEEEIKNYVYHKIDSYLEKNPNLISRTYKTSIDNFLNSFINEISDELKEYSKLRLNESSYETHNINSNSNINYTEKEEPEDLGPRVIPNGKGTGFIILRRPDGTKVSSSSQKNEENKTINYYFFINKIENKTLIYNENLEHIRTIDGVEKISKEMFNNYIPINLEDIKKLK